MASSTRSTRPLRGLPQIRDLGFIVAGGGRWTEVKREKRCTITTPAPWLLLPQVVHEGEGYRLTLELLPDPSRDVLLISYRLEGEGMRLNPLLAPHLSRSGTNNTAWVESSGLYAQRQDRSLCLASYPPFGRGSAGFVGASDGWQDFARHGAMTWEFTRAADGNVALMGELDAPTGVLALAFALTPQGARTLAWSSLAEGYSHVREMHFGSDRWERTGDRAARPLGLGMFGVRLDPGELCGAEVRFTRFYPSTQRWEARDHLVALGSSAE